MKLLFMACLSPKTGNCTTAERIREHIEAAGHTCVLRDTADFKNPEDVADLIAEEKYEGALAIHLYKSGRLLLDSCIPFGIVFGGTDINEDVKGETKRPVMGQVLQKARFAVAFSNRLKEEAEAFWPFHGSKIYVQPQGIETKAGTCFNWRSFLRRTGIDNENVDDLHVFVLVCGLRRVKDPLYLVNVFSEWHVEDPSVYLIIIGPEIDPLFAKEVELNVKRARGVFLAPERPQEELHAAMRRSFALVNSSVSEGMSAAVLEAMHLGVPVLARNIPGNAAIVIHEDTGLLFSNPQEFIELSKRLIREPALREQIVCNARAYVREQHSRDKERDTYQQLLQHLH
ncbi:glycosyltransferase 1 domain-containing protein 1-like [Acipenser oxyrinchus oxyrinchus]|uniref:Glycosyltransferase 1 domain-containing protein 1-like n=1 Tax=Acipenser oxyrinchus oxyrinchus TaxID=40147 RepID=A0AAD8FX20_ACIOX|nr:glycosyltransferase 1 domain-containing protein 1-like [Acipenser oxyrinchus oxyrinchus]